jgi:hypothetical protein
VALSTAEDQVQLFTIGTDRQVWTSWWTDADGAWSLWQPLGGQLNPSDGIAALSRTAGLVELYARGQDSAVWQDWWRAEDGWSGWFHTAPGGVAVGTPSVVVPPRRVGTGRAVPDRHRPQGLDSRLGTPRLTPIAGSGAGRTDAPTHRRTDAALPATLRTLHTRRPAESAVQRAKDRGPMTDHRRRQMTDAR